MGRGFDSRRRLQTSHCAFRRQTPYSPGSVAPRGWVTYSANVYAPIELAAIVGKPTYDRGLQYANEGRAEVTERSDAPADPYVAGTCRGTGALPYRTEVEYRTSKNGVISHLDGSCSCPVGRNCKHAVALLIEALREDQAGEAAPAVPDWKTQLEQIFPRAASSDPLALIFDFERAGTSPAPPTLGSGWWNAASRRDSLKVMPMRPGKKKPWIATGASWHEIRSNAGAGFERGQAAALDQLDQLWQARNRIGGSPKWLPLTSLDSPLLFPVLQQVAESGVQLLDSEALAPVNLSPVPGRAAVAIREDADGAVLVKAELTHPELGPDDAFIALGTPPHAVAWKRGGQLTLARLDPPATREWVWLSRDPGGITIPASDRDRFEKEALLPISRVGWVSPDDSFIPEPPPPPTLHLQVDLAPGGEPAAQPVAHLTWEWGYGDERKGFAAATAEDPTRDAAAERELVGAAQTAMDLLPAEPRIEREQTLQGLDVVRLLNEAVPALQEKGVRVAAGEAPIFRPATDSAIRVRTTPRAGRDWLDLEVTMDVDGVQVPMAVLITALTGKESALFLEDGTYVDLESPELDELRELLEEAQALSDGRRQTLEVPRVRASWWEELANLDVVHADPGSWLEAVRRAAAQPPETPGVPEGLTAVLRPYQEEGYAWLAGLRRSGLGGVLADDMGLGKTLQALAMILDERETNPERDGLWLVVAPTSVVSNWKTEAERFAPGLRVATVDATAKKRGQSLFQVAKDADVLITSYTLLRLEEEDYAALPVVGMIADEAQQAKNPASRTFGSLVRVGAPVVYAITGTPMENNLGELWAMFALTAPGLLGSHQQFTKTYRRPIEKNDAYSVEPLGRLRRRIAPFLLRRNKNEVARDLPPKQEQTLTVDLAPGHRRIYDRQLQRERQRVLHLASDLDRNRIEVLSALTRLRQLALDATLVDADAQVPSSKIDELIPLLREAAAEDHRVLVFSQFTRYLHLVAERLKAEGIDFSYLDGSTADRAAVIDDFAAGDAPVFLISLKAGGVGLNLTMADYVVLMDPWWNPAVESQAVDRTHRIGQENPVHVYRFVARGTIEEKVLALQESKRRLFEDLVREDEAGSGVGGAALTADELRALLE